jgi:hypothetical protein
MDRVNLEKLDNDIFYYKDAIADPQALINLINETDALASENSLIDKWKPFHAPKRPDSQFGLKKVYYSLRPGPTPQELIDLHKLVYSYIYSAANDYAKHKGIDVGHQYQITFLKYFKNTFLGPHTDAQSDPGLHISCVVYLNDDYDGGELKFNNHNISIKPSAGSIFVFPSTDPFVHQSMPVKNGHKYLITGFWYPNEKNILNVSEDKYEYK